MSGTTTPDAGVTWTAIKPLRLLGTVSETIDRHSFRSTPLQMPALPTNNTALISVRNNASAGTTLEIDDGVNPPITAEWFVDTSGGQVAADIIRVIRAASPSGITITAITGTTNIGLLNASGAQANIVKTGDIANPPALNILNFAPGYLDGGTITWRSGNNYGATTELKAYLTDGSIVVTWLGMTFLPQTGDTFYYTPGCDKTRETCYFKFNNILNFRGEPDMPGLDSALLYPEAP